MNNQTASGVAANMETPITREQWKWTWLAGMASYLDAGSIVALGAGLAIFQTSFGLTNTEVGVLAAIGPNAIGCAVGAIIDGWLDDKLGRKRIYQYDLLVYAAGVLCIALAVNREMLFAGTVIVGLAVGADVPTSLALVGEFAPSHARGKLMGLTMVAWTAGPAVVLFLALVLARFDLLGVRIVFLHLFVVALITWALRRGLKESTRWQEAAKDKSTTKHAVGSLFKGAHLRAMAWTTTIYLFWNLAAGTSGIFTPYIIRTLNAGSQAASVGISLFQGVVGVLITTLVFMKYIDHSHQARRLLWLVGMPMQILAFGLYLVLPFNIPVIVANCLLYGIGANIAGEGFYKVYSQELFPTMLRSTAQGFTFGLARLVLGVWSFFVPVLANTGIAPVAALLVLFIAISGVVGYCFMPNTARKSLEQIESERA